MSKLLKIDQNHMCFYELYSNNANRPQPGDKSIAESNDLMDTNSQNMKVMGL